MDATKRKTNKVSATPGKTRPFSEKSRSFCKSTQRNFPAIESGSSEKTKIVRNMQINGKKEPLKKMRQQLKKILEGPNIIFFEPEHTKINFQGQTPPGYISGAPDKE